MTLIGEIAPFLLLAAIVCLAAGIYLVQASEQRRRLRPSAGQRPLADGRADPVATRPTTPALELEKPRRGASPSQIAQLHELGVPNDQIATALGVPLEEVTLVVMIRALGAKDAFGRRSTSAEAAETLTELS